MAYNLDARNLSQRRTGSRESRSLSEPRGLSADGRQANDAAGNNEPSAVGVEMASSAIAPTSTSTLPETTSAGNTTIKSPVPPTVIYMPTPGIPATTLLPNSEPSTSSALSNSKPTSNLASNASTPLGSAASASASTPNFPQPSTPTPMIPPPIASSNSMTTGRRPNARFSNLAVNVNVNASNPSKKSAASTIPSAGPGNWKANGRAISGANTTAPAIGSADSTPITPMNVTDPRELPSTSGAPTSGTHVTGSTAGAGRTPQPTPSRRSSMSMPGSFPPSGQLPTVAPQLGKALKAAAGPRGQKRSTKTSQKLIELPSGPQTKPFVDGDSEEEDWPHEYPGSEVGEFIGDEEQRRLGLGRTRKRLREYRSAGERMTKDQRKNAGYKRLTAYCVAEGFKMNLLKMFLKREHNVQPRVYDEACYVMYHLPLLPGYGPRTNVRSSMPVKLATGKTLMSHFSEVEEDGYQGTYFKNEEAYKYYNDGTPGDSFAGQTAEDPFFDPSGGGFDRPRDADESEAEGGQGTGASGLEDNVYAPEFQGYIDSFSDSSPEARRKPGLAERYEESYQQMETAAAGIETDSRMQSRLDPDLSGLSDTALLETPLLMGSPGSVSSSETGKRTNSIGTPFSAIAATSTRMQDGHGTSTGGQVGPSTEQEQLGYLSDAPSVEMPLLIDALDAQRVMELNTRFALDLDLEYEDDGSGGMVGTDKKRPASKTGLGITTARPMGASATKPMPIKGILKNPLSPPLPAAQSVSTIRDSIPAPAAAAVVGGRSESDTETERETESGKTATVAGAGAGRSSSTDSSGDRTATTIGSSSSMSSTPTNLAVVVGILKDPNQQAINLAESIATPVSAATKPTMKPPTTPEIAAVAAEAAVATVAPRQRQAKQLSLHSSRRHQATPGLRPQPQNQPRPARLHKFIEERAPDEPGYEYAHSTAEVVFFDYGVVVFFGLDERYEKDILEDVARVGGAVRRMFPEEDWEVEECHFEYNTSIGHPRIYNDFFTLKSHSHLLKLSIAHALAQSTLLGHYETTASGTLTSQLARSIPRQLAFSGGLKLRRHEALKFTGALFKLRRDVNLVSNVLDVPELFWTEASLKLLYDAVREYMEIDGRIMVLNEKLGIASDFLDAIHDHLNNNAMERITWIIIWLIVVAILVELGEVVARLVVHAVISTKEKKQQLGSAPLAAALPEVPVAFTSASVCTCTCPHHHGVFADSGSALVQAQGQEQGLLAMAVRQSQFGPIEFVDATDGVGNGEVTPMVNAPAELGLGTKVSPAAINVHSRDGAESVKSRSIRGALLRRALRKGRGKREEYRIGDEIVERDGEKEKEVSGRGGRIRKWWLGKNE